MNNLVLTEFNGTSIAITEGKMVNMTNLWKASGGKGSQEVKHWVALPSTVKFMGTVASKLNVGKSDLLQSTRGRNGGTFAHWQIALAYAKYLSPELHMHVNEVFKERLEETANPELSISRGRQRAVDAWKKQGRTDAWIEQRISSIEGTKVLNTVLTGRGTGWQLYRGVADELNKGIVGMTSKKFREVKGIPKSKGVREGMTDEENAALSFASLATARKLREQNISGNHLCNVVAKDVALKVSAIMA